jgi:predicted CDP-diglyceride synthetase/phosphatidate cytidylyltransferase
MFWQRKCLLPVQEGNTMLMTVFAILFVAWLLGLTAFHVASGLIHLLLVLAVISLVMHFVRGGRSVV